MVGVSQLSKTYNNYILINKWLTGTWFLKSQKDFLNTGYHVPFSFEVLVEIVFSPTLFLNNNNNNNNNNSSKGLLTAYPTVVGSLSVN